PLAADLPSLAMTRRWRGGVRAAVLVACALGTCLPAPAQEPPAVSPAEAVEASLRDGFRLADERRYDEAEALFASALEQAQALGTIRLQAEARRGRGLLRYRRLQYAEARPELEEARRLYEAAGDVLGLGQAISLSGSVAYAEAHADEARELYTRALEL